MAPSKKRKAAAAPATPSKKVRIGSSTTIPAQSLSSPAGRPKRTSNASPPAIENEVPVKKRGRPPKNAAPPKPVSNGRGRPRTITAEPPTAVEAEVAPRKRGRPPKASTSAARALNSSLSKTAQVATNKKAAPKVTTTAKRGRKSNALLKQDEPSTEDETETDHPSTDAGAETARNRVGNTGKPEDLSGVDPEVQYWLMKAEPESRIEKGRDVKFSIDDLAAKTVPEAWDGVRNAVARNNMRAMRKGDLAFFYHSNCKIPGIFGVMRIVAEHSPDESAFNPDHPYFDPKSDRAKPKWDAVHVDFVKKFQDPITLRELKSFAQSGGVLQNMQTLRQSRLSVSAVSPTEWRFILDLAEEPITLGHGDGKGGYESDLDGEGEETAGISDADGLPGQPDETLDAPTRNGIVDNGLSTVDNNPDEV